MPGVPAQGRGTHLQVKGLRLGFQVRSLSSKPHKGFSGTLCKMLTTSRQYAEPFFGLPRTIYILKVLLFFDTSKMKMLVFANGICKWGTVIYRWRSV
jgi:hypothetical protein